MNEPVAYVLLEHGALTVKIDTDNYFKQFEPAPEIKKIVNELTRNAPPSSQFELIEESNEFISVEPLSTSEYFDTPMKMSQVQHKTGVSCILWFNSTDVNVTLDPLEGEPLFPDPTVTVGNGELYADWDKDSLYIELCPGSALGDFPFVLPNEWERIPSEQTVEGLVVKGYPDWKITAYTQMG